MKASTTYRNFIIMVILLTIQSCQQGNNAETKDNTPTKLNLRIMSTSNQTHNHQAIRQWVEARNGIPARVIRTASNDEEGTLKIHFPEFGKANELQEISWEDFFNDFEKEELDFLYQEQKANGKPSTFYQLVARLGSGPRVPPLKG